MAAGSDGRRAAAAVACASCELHAEAVFRVEGMDCSEEVAILERRLKPLDGMESVAADVMGQRLHVKYDAARLSTSTMVDAIGPTGMRMWLEHEEPLAASADVNVRFWMTVATAALMALAQAATLAGVEDGRLLLLAATVVGAVYPARRAIVALRGRNVDINVLMVVAVAGALALGEWFEAASVVFLFAVAQWLEVRTLERARQAIRALVDLSPREATVRRNGQEARVAVESLRAGELVVVRPGEKMPVDGTVAAGESDVNEAPITGESLPLHKAAGDVIYAGTINGRGALDVAVTRVGRDTRLASIIHLVEDAQSKRAPVQSFVDRFARIYTPIVIALAALIVVVPPLATGAEWNAWLYRGLVLLVIACPCALVISTPVSIVAALSAAARHGVLVKGGAHLERLASIRTVAIDKTGTLTRGELRVTEVRPLGDATASDVLRYAAAVESRSEHPIANAVLHRARQDGVDVPMASGFTSRPGLGATAFVAGRAVAVGGPAFLATRGVAIPASAPPTSSSNSTVWVEVDGMLLGGLSLADNVRGTAREAVAMLREQGITRVVMLTGDQEAAARDVATATGVDEWNHGLLPEDKLARIEALRRERGPVLMLGDGVNDAPALAAADVGVAMGAASSDAALETADVALMSDELLKLPYALRLARATLRNVKTNVAVSLVLKAAFLALALTGSATLWMAVLADTGASVIVVANALRLLRAR
jgi:Zn2+/Cd2+-exporting ATPase